MKNIVFLGAFFVFTNAFAGTTKIGWRDCGIGAMIFPSTPWAAVTSNITWDMGLTASTSSTSSPSQCAGKSASIAKFINQNYALIEEQTASGAGKHLTTMLEMANCNKSFQPQIVDQIRQNLFQNVQNSTFLKKTENEKAEIYYNNLIDQINQRFNSNCVII